MPSLQKDFSRLDYHTGIDPTTTATKNTRNHRKDEVREKKLCKTEYTGCAKTLILCQKILLHLTVIPFRYTSPFPFSSSFCIHSPTQIPFNSIPIVMYVLLCASVTFCVIPFQPQQSHPHTHMPENKSNSKLWAHIVIWTYRTATEEMKK